MAKTSEKTTKAAGGARSLVIVESPAKAGTIGKILGSAYRVASSVGHVRDLPKTSLGIDVDDDFKPRYQVIPGKQKVLSQLRKLASEAPMVYLAPDPDREGEAIAWHLAEALKLPARKTARVTFNEITGKAVREAFRHPGQIDMKKVDAQQARRILDRLVGYELSPLLWKKVAKGLSAGRVQSVAVRLIVEREREIENFVAREFWKITARVRPICPDGRPIENGEFDCELALLDGEKANLHTSEEAEKALERLRGARFSVSELKERLTLNNPLPPFTTSQLQQQASVQLRFSASKTMTIAQQLYEGVEVGPEGSVGLITYMRTDSVRVAEEAIAACRDLIPKKFSAEYLAPQPRHYRARRGAQEAHEAIRPTDVTREPDSLKGYLTPDQLKLYRLIWNRFVASQMAAARIRITEVTIAAEPGQFKAKGRRIEFPGHFILSGPTGGEEQALPALQVGQMLDVLILTPSQHFTKPPPRYTEATLVRALEREGIGRPSTYAAIVSTIQERGYVEQKSRLFYATDLGKIVTELLVKYFPEVLDVKFTAHMEEDLDKIEEGHAESTGVLKEFYGVFHTALERAYENMEQHKGAPDPEHRTCHVCGKEMLIRWSKHGRYLACSNYPNCRTTVPLSDNGEAMAPTPTEHVCEKCGKPMVLRNGRRGPFLACSAYPKCRFTLSADAQGRPLKVDPSEKRCEKCGSEMVIRVSRRGPFLACSAYPKCRNARPLPTGVPCPVEGCDGQLVQRSARGRGTFYGCSNYPSCKYVTRELASVGQVSTEKASAKPLPDSPQEPGQEPAK